MKIRTTVAIVGLAFLFAQFAYAQETSLKRLKRAQNDIEARTQELETRVGTNEQDVINLRGRVRVLDGRNQSQRRELRGLKQESEARLLDLRSRTTQLETSAGELSESVDKNEEGLNLIKGKLEAQGVDLSTLDTRADSTKGELDRFWILISAALVFLMQAGFKSLEVGMVRAEHRASVGVKNVIDWLVVSVAYYLVGFGLMYGDSIGGVYGFTMFAPSPQTMPAEFKLEFFLFQLAFAGTAATIVSGAISERSALTSYLFSSVIISVLIYPLFGHWVWGGLYLTDNQPWLATLGFHDFAGGTVVHSIGAWVALVGIWRIGPRLGRFDPQIEATGRFLPSDLGYSALGVFILWAGWWGFNGGSVLAYDDRVSIVILSTNLAAATAGVAAFLHSLYTDRQNTFSKLLGGTLGGLVAITPCCDVVSTWDALIIGILAGIVHNIAYDAMIHFRLDDPVGAVPVHGACGAFGTLAVGLFARADQIQKFGLCAEPGGPGCVTPGLLAGGGFEQFLVQLIGVIVAFILSSALALVTFWAADFLIGLRVSGADEENGFALLHGQQED